MGWGRGGKGASPGGRPEKEQEADLPVLDTIAEVKGHQPAAHAKHIVVRPRLRSLPPHQPSKVMHLLHLTSPRLPAALSHSAGCLFIHSPKMPNLAQQNEVGHVRHFTSPALFASISHSTINSQLAHLVIFSPKEGSYAACHCHQSPDCLQQSPTHSMFHLSAHLPVPHLLNPAAS